MYIRASSSHGWDNLHIMEIHHQYSSQLCCQVKSNAQPPDLECQKLSDFWSHSYVIIAYIINFQVQLSPGKIHFKFELHILGLCLSVCWVLGIRKEKSASNIRVTSTMRNRSQSSGLLIR